MPKSKSVRNPKKPMKKPKPINQAHKALGELHILDQESRNMMGTVSRMTPYLINKKLVEAGKTEEIHNQAKILSRDIMTFSTQLAEISKDLPVKINPENPAEITAALSLSERYLEWQGNFERVILPTINRLAELFTDAVTVLNGQLPANEAIDPESIPSEADIKKSEVTHDGE